MDDEVLVVSPFERRHVLCILTITFEWFGELRYHLAAVQPALVAVKLLERVLEIREAAVDDHLE